MPPRITPAEEWEARLGRRADAVEGAYAAWTDELSGRDRDVLAALDAGCSWSQVSRWCRISEARLSQLVARAAAT